MSFVEDEADLNFQISNSQSDSYFIRDVVGSIFTIPEAVDFFDLTVAQSTYCENKGAISEIVFSANYGLIELENYWLRVSSPMK